VMQAESMADLMRANSFGVESGFYNVVNLPGGVMPTAFPTDCATTACNAQDRATYDLVTWNFATAGTPREANAEVLPLGIGVVCRDSTPEDGTSAGWACDNNGNVYAIKIEWQERTAGADDDDSDVRTERFVMTVLPALDES
jgi:type IV pilus assembly protein PilV